MKKMREMKRWGEEKERETEDGEEVVRRGE